MLPSALSYLVAFPRWINWALVPDPHRPDKPKKVPISPLTGAYIAANDPAHHVTYEQALATGKPVGFVFTKGDKLWFLDIDNCREADGSWSQIAQHLVASLPGSAWEVSQSGKGLHGFGYAADIPEHGCKNIPLGLELYTADRFCAITGLGTSGAVTLDSSAALAAVVGQFFVKSSQSSDIVDWTEGPQEGGGITTDDDELLSIMMRSGQKSTGAFFDANHVAFADLWHADADKLGAKWPSQKGAYDESQADSALASHLAFWTAKDCARIERLMQRSALKRGKWEREDYLPRTILGVIRTIRNVAKPRDVPTPLTAASGLMATVTATTAHPSDTAAIASPGPPQADTPLGTRGISFMTPQEQTTFFSGCVYVSDLNRIWVPGDGTLQDKPRFDITYGGSEFVTKPGNLKPEKSAWEAYTRNQFYAPAVAKGICFRPELPSGSITYDAHVNTYIPIATPQQKGDVTKWIIHMEKLFPNPDDLAIVISWIAALIRNPGYKAQWALVLQGAEGNGKSLLNVIMSFAIGSQYTHYARASALAKTGMQFNKWVMGKLYVAFEEINVGEKRDFLDEVKDLITNARMAMEGKGADQFTGDNRANLTMFTNHKGAVPITRDTRRYAVFYCPQQNADDLEAWGMSNGYFADLWDWLEGRNAYAHLGTQAGLKAINYWLHNEAVIDVRYDPTGQCQRAPKTSSTVEALSESLGTIEQEVLEHVHAGAAGFADGWLSSYDLGRLLERLRVGRMAHSKRRDMLRHMGYVPHPGLPDGRAPNMLPGVGQRPVLYIRETHLHAQLRDAQAIQAAYEAAQAGRAPTVTGLGDVVEMTPRGR